MSEGYTKYIQIPCRGVVLQLSPAEASLLDFERRDMIKHYSSTRLNFSITGQKGLTRHVSFELYFERTLLKNSSTDAPTS